MDNTLLLFVRQALSIAKQQVSTYSSKYSKKVFTQPQLVVLNLLRIREEWTYRKVETYLEVMDTVQEELGLKRVPDHSTLQKPYDRIGCWRWRWFLKETTNRTDSSGKLAADATGFNRRWASRHYTKRTGMKLKALKVTILADVGQPMAVRDVHITVGRKHDTKILPKLIPRDESGSVLAADKGYDDETLRELCRQRGIRPVIKYREYGPQDEQANDQMVEEGYNQRQKVESVFSVVKRKYGEEVQSRVWYRQFRDIIATMVIHNLDRIIQNISLLKIKENVRLLHLTVRI